MALDGIAAIQAQIREIEQRFALAPATTTRQATAATATNSAVSSAGTTDFASLLASLGPANAATASTTATGTSPTAQAFLDTALSQRGKPYVYGATAATTDPSPRAFDCSELTKWAAARVGVTIPDGATAQYLYARDHGMTMTVDQALHTPGALLFHFSHEPRNLGDIPADGHVAISVGDGVHTIEARGHKYGTNVFDATKGREFNFAAMIPGM
jgi:cell wall-associated NlpC family hydrolase